MPAELAGESLALMEFVTNPAVKIVMHLAKNAIPLEVDALALTDFEECDYAGYAPVRLTEWHSIETNDELLGEVISDYAEFVSGEVTAPQRVTAVYVTKQIEDNDPEMFWVEFFDIPLLISEAEQEIRKRFRVNSLGDLSF